MNVRQRTVTANGLRFAYLEAGSRADPMVLLLHGFPDNPWSWEHQFEPLAARGYRVVAPFMRGYAPSEVPPDGRTDFTTLGHDAVEIVRVLNDGNACLAVGHDIGALQLQAAIAEARALFPRPAFIAVNHALTAPGAALIPRLAHRSFHIWLLAHDALNDVVAAHDNMALIDYIWDLWSSPGHRYATQLGRVKHTLAQPGSLKAAVSVYTNFIPGENSGLPQATMRPAEQPTLLIYGSDDVLPPALTQGEERYYVAEFRREVIEGCVHWPQRERPNAVNAILLDWFREFEPRPAASDPADAIA
jgi:pimeloyl-ACP methyl ester carboxylesterase